MSSSDPPPPSPSAKSPVTPTASSSAPSTTTPLPPQLAALLQSLSQSRSVLGVLLLSRTHSSSPSTSGNTTVIRSQGATFDGVKGREYAGRIGRMVRSVEEGCAIEPGEGQAEDALKLLRIRTTKHELIITPDPNYVLVVLQDPGQ